MKNTKPSQKDIRLCVETILENPEDIQDAFNGIDEMIDEAYDAGYANGMVDGALEYEEDNPQQNEELVGVTFAVGQFEDCKTLSDFQDKYKEILMRSYNFM